jgi:hypothetical protein
MDNLTITITMATAAFAAIALMSLVGLKGFTAWLDLKRAELDRDRQVDIATPSANNRIEIADLKERIRKLEAIAAGVDL